MNIIIVGIDLANKHGDHLLSGNTIYICMMARLQNQILQSCSLRQVKRELA